MMPGQGQPLPSFLERDGEWIIEKFLFIYHSGSGGTTSPQFTIGAERNDGGRAIGFDSDQLAAALGINREALIAANHSGSLVYLGEAIVPPGHGGISAKAYGFQIGERMGSLTIETYDQEGKG